MTELSERFLDFDSDVVVCRKGKDITIKARTDIEAGHLTVPIEWCQGVPAVSLAREPSEISTPIQWVLKYNGWLARKKN